MKRQIISAAYYIFSYLNYAQIQEPTWVQHLKGYRTEVMGEICKVGSENFWVPTHYNSGSQPIFSNGKAGIQLEFDSLSSKKSSRHSSIAIYSKQGALINFIHLLSGTSAVVQKIWYDPSGAVCIGGSFQNQILIVTPQKKEYYFDCPNNYIDGSFGSGHSYPANRGFIARFSLNGELEWFRQFGGTSSSCNIKDLISDKNGNVYAIINHNYGHNFITDSQVIVKSDYMKFLICFDKLGKEKWLQSYSNYCELINLFLDTENKVKLFMQSSDMYAVTLFSLGYQNNLLRKKIRDNKRHFNCFHLTEQGELKDTIPIFSTDINYSIHVGKMFSLNGKYYLPYLAQAPIHQVNEAKKPYQTLYNPDSFFVQCMDKKFNSEWFVKAVSGIVYYFEVNITSSNPNSICISSPRWKKYRFTDASGKTYDLPSNNCGHIMLFLDKKGLIQHHFNYGNIHHDGYNMGHFYAFSTAADSQSYIATGVVLRPMNLFGQWQNIHISHPDYQKTNLDTMQQLRYYRRYDGFLFKLSLRNSKIQSDVSSLPSYMTDTLNRNGSGQSYLPAYNPINSSSKEYQYQVKDTFDPQISGSQFFDLGKKLKQQSSMNTLFIQDIYAYPSYKDSIQLKFISLNNNYPVELKLQKTGKVQKIKAFTGAYQNNMVAYGIYTWSINTNSENKKLWVYILKGWE